MKKLLIYLSIIAVLFAGLYFLNQASNQQALAKYKEPAERLYKTSPDKLEQITREQLLDDNYQNIIIPKELDEALENKEDLIVYLFSPACSFCKQTTPVLNDIAEEVGAQYRQLNVYEYENEWEKYNLEGTPTLIAFEDGVEVDRLYGGISTSPGNTEEDFKSFLEKHKK